MQVPSPKPSVQDQVSQLWIHFPNGQKVFRLFKRELTVSKSLPFTSLSGVGVHVGGTLPQWMQPAGGSDAET